MELYETEEEVIIVHQKREVHTANMAALIPMIKSIKKAFQTHRVVLQSIRSDILELLIHVISFDDEHYFTHSTSVDLQPL